MKRTSRTYDMHARSVKKGLLKFAEVTSAWDDSNCTLTEYLISGGVQEACHAPYPMSGCEIGWYGKKWNPRLSPIPVSYEAIGRVHAKCISSNFDLPCSSRAFDSPFCLPSSLCHTHAHQGPLLSQARICTTLCGARSIYNPFFPSFQRRKLWTRPYSCVSMICCSDTSTPPLRTTLRGM